MGAAVAKVEVDPLFPARPASLFTDDKTAYPPKQLQKITNRIHPLLSVRIRPKELVSLVLEYAAPIHHIWQESPTYEPEPILIEGGTMRCTDPTGAFRSFRIISRYSVKVTRRWRIQIEFQPYQRGWIAVGVTSVGPSAAMRSYFDRSTATTDVLLMPARHPPALHVVRMCANTPSSETFYELSHLMLERTKSMAILEVDESGRNLCIDCAEKGGPSLRMILPITTDADLALWPCVIGGETVAVTILPWP
jgi:hypothetical protein